MPKNEVSKGKTGDVSSAAPKTAQAAKKAADTPSSKAAKKSSTASAVSKASKQTASAPKKETKQKSAATASKKETKQKSAAALPQGREEKTREPSALLPVKEPRKELPQERSDARVAPSEQPVTALTPQGESAAPTNAVPPPMEMPPRSREEWRLLLRRVLACLLLCAVLAGSVLVYLHRPTAYTERKTSVAFVYSDTRGVTTVLVNGSPVGDPLPGICRTYAYSGDGRVCAAIVDNDLYLVRGTKLSLIAVDVQDYALAQNGDVLAYRTVGNELFYCTLGRKTAYYSITRAATAAHYRLSPNGKELFYTYLDGDVQRAEVYSRTNSAPRFEATVGLLPVAVGDRCAYLYYKDATGALYYMTGKGGAPVLCQQGGDFTLAFNRDFSEMLITCVSGVSLWVEGEQIAIPSIGAGEHIRFLANARAAVLSHPDGMQYLVKSLLEGYYVRTGAEGEGAMLAYLDRDGTLTGVSFVSQARSDVTVTDQGVYYIEITEKNGEVQRNLFRCKLGKTEPERLSFVNVTEFRTSRDGDRLFYTDAHGALYTMKPGDDPVRFQGADSIVTGSLTVTADNIVYYTVGDTLWRSDNGADPEPLRDTPAAARADAYTVYFTEPNASGAITLHTSHRARKGSKPVAEDVTAIK